MALTLFSVRLFCERRSVLQISWTGRTLRGRRHEGRRKSMNRAGCATPPADRGRFSGIRRRRSGRCEQGFRVGHERRVARTVLVAARRRSAHGAPEQLGGLVQFRAITSSDSGGSNRHRSASVSFRRVDFILLGFRLVLGKELLDLGIYPCRGLGSLRNAVHDGCVKSMKPLPELPFLKLGT
jgi:hypothetical protein